MMDKNKILQNIKNDFAQFHQESLDISKSIKEMEKDALLYMHELLSRMKESHAVGGALLAKSPNLLRNRRTRTNAVLHSYEIIDNSSSSSSEVEDVTLYSPCETGDDSFSASTCSSSICDTSEEVFHTRTKRKAAVKAAKVMKELVYEEDDSIFSSPESEKKSSNIKQELYPTTKVGKKSKSKYRRLIIMSSEEEEEEEGDDGLEPSRIEGSRYSMEPKNDSNNDDDSSPKRKEYRIKERKVTDQNDKVEGHLAGSPLLAGVSTSKNKMNHIINETIDSDETTASIYEDAVGKTISSISCTAETLDELPNTASVEIDPPSTKTIFDRNFIPEATSFSEESHLPNDDNMKEACIAKSNSVIKNCTNMQNSMNFDTSNGPNSDDTSHDILETKKDNDCQQKHASKYDSGSINDAEVAYQTPARILREGTPLKTVCKQKVLCTPYTKESVKKRVAAFEQAIKSPELEREGTAEIEIQPVTILANPPEISAPIATEVTADIQSSAKNKNISMTEQKEKSNDKKKDKDVNVLRSVKKNINTLDRVKQNLELKATPLRNNQALQMPNSVSKTQFATPLNKKILNSNSKALTTPRGKNPFVQSMKSIYEKMIDRTAEEKRRAREEEAPRRREELLHMVTEEKRRKREEKELRNKLARLQAEKEKNEKAEKQRGEMEKKHLSQSQRTQEEEKNSQKDLPRSQYKQPKQKKLLAEEENCEQKLEKQKQTELKNQMEEVQLQAKSQITTTQNQILHSYKIDSDPDTEQFDGEEKPKYQIAQWALGNKRQDQLLIQRYISMEAVLKFFGAQTSIDPQKLFPDTDPKRLERSDDSAVWKTPPRYSMMKQSIIED